MLSFYLVFTKIAKTTRLTALYFMAIIEIIALNNIRILLITLCNNHLLRDADFKNK